jgi:hypothetical protein
MTTIAKRAVRSSPFRNTSATWEKIVDLLTRGANSPARAELLSVTGTASSIISDQAPRDAAIVVTCTGPRTRVYCIYDENAVEGSDAQEDALNYDPLKGDWAVSLPCLKEDLAWVQRALEEKSQRITARDASQVLDEDEKQATKATALTVDQEAFFRS